MIHTVTRDTSAGMLITGTVLRGGNKTKEQRRVSDLHPEGGETVKEHPKIVIPCGSLSCRNPDPGGHWRLSTWNQRKTSFSFLEQFFRPRQTQRRGSVTAGGNQGPMESRRKRSKEASDGHFNLKWPLPTRCQ